MLGPQLAFLLSIFESRSRYVGGEEVLICGSKSPYRAAPVLAVPPWPVLLGADCVVPGPVAVDDVGLRFIAYAIAAITSTATMRAPMPHMPRRFGSVDVRGGSPGS